MRYDPGKVRKMLERYRDLWGGGTGYPVPTCTYREAGRVAGGRRLTEPNHALMNKVMIDAAMQDLTRDHRRALDLAYRKGMTQRRAAAVMDIHQSTVSRLVRDGIEELADVLNRSCQRLHHQHCS